MKGWKTKLGTALIAVASFLPLLGDEWAEVAKQLAGLGAAIAAYGIAHKVEKSGEGGR